jgi:hypothetical protein
MSDESLEQQLAKLDDAALLAAVNNAIKGRQKPVSKPGEIVDWRNLSDDDFYLELFPHDGRNGPRALRDHAFVPCSSSGPLVPKISAA